jgi:hypothetical protein
MIGHEFPYPYLVPPPRPLNSEEHRREQHIPDQGLKSTSATPALDRRQQLRPTSQVAAAAGWQQAMRQVGAAAGQAAGSTWQQPVGPPPAWQDPAVKAAAAPSWQQPPTFRAIDVDREAGYDTHLSYPQPFLLHNIPDKMDDLNHIDGYVDVPSQKSLRVVAEYKKPRVSERLSTVDRESFDSVGGKRLAAGGKAALTLAQLSAHLSAPPPPAQETSTPVGTPARKVNKLGFSTVLFFLKNTLRKLASCKYCTKCS